LNTSKTAHEWSKDALFLKAKRYAQVMLEAEHTDWQFGFWSVLTLEMLIRTAFSNISPVLVADGKDWNNILYAVGKEPIQPKFNPKSADISELLKRAENVFPNLTREMLNFSVTHVNRRNSELHSGSLPFDGLGTSSWLPMFYATCEVLLHEVGESLDSLLGASEAKEAKAHIVALHDENAKSVKGTIAAHATIWTEKSEKEKHTLSNQANTLMTRHRGHRVSCPACQCVALIHGTPSGAPKATVDEDGVVEKQNMLPASFECLACGLRISGYSKLVACGLGDSYILTSHSDAVDYFNVDIEEEFRGMMAEDNNEPY